MKSTTQLAPGRFDCMYILSRKGRFTGLMMHPSCFHLTTAVATPGSSRLLPRRPAGRVRRLRARPRPGLPRPERHPGDHAGGAGRQPRRRQPGQRARRPAQAFASWQENEVLQFGPAAPLAVAGGQELRDQIYSWPLVSRCAVEETLVSRLRPARLLQRGGQPARPGGAGGAAVPRRRRHRVRTDLAHRLERQLGRAGRQRARQPPPRLRPGRGRRRARARSRPGLGVVTGPGRLRAPAGQRRPRQPNLPDHAGGAQRRQRRPVLCRGRQQGPQAGARNRPARLRRGALPRAPGVAVRRARQGQPRRQPARLPQNSEGCGPRATAGSASTTC